MTDSSGAAPQRASTTLLLPSVERLSGPPGEATARVLARGDRESVAPGDEPQLLRQFDVLPRGLPVAALTRQYDRRDAAHQTWLRADPACLHADLGAGRLMAIGELGLSEEDAEALLAPLRPLFGDDGCPISAGTPSRWYLALSADARLPIFAAPGDVLGDDIFAHLPQGDLGWRWRRLLSEAQVTLHNHPLNAQRVAAGLRPVNSLWFWGAGRLPDSVRCMQSRFFSDDLLLASLATQAGVARSDLPSALPVEASQPGTVIDLRRLRSFDALEGDWMVPLLAQQARTGVDLVIDGAGGARVRYQRSHRWRVWRRAAPLP